MTFAFTMTGAGARLLRGLRTTRPRSYRYFSFFELDLLVLSQKAMIGIYIGCIVLLARSALSYPVVQYGASAVALEVQVGVFPDFPPELSKPLTMMLQTN